MRPLFTLGCLATALLTGCSAAPRPLDVGEVRRSVESAGESPEDCPLLDVPAAAEKAGLEGQVTLASATATVAENTEVPDDVLAAQVEDGMSPLEVAAGSSVECDFTIGGDEVRVDLVTSINDEFVAPSVFVARVQSLDDTFTGNPEDLVAFVDEVRPGDSSTLPDGRAVLRRLEVEGDGSAALLVSSDDLDSGDLEDISDALVEAMRA